MWNGVNICDVFFILLKQWKHRKYKVEIIFDKSAALLKYATQLLNE